MITIYNDFDKTKTIEPDDYNWIASQPQDYIPLRRRIRQALDDPYHHYQLYIQHRILAEWLRDLRDYPPYRLKWEEINLREQFREKFGFPPPLGLNNAAIQKLNLCELPLPTRSETNDPTGWILGQYLGSVWQPAEPHPTHLADFTAWTLQTAPIDEILAPLTEARLKQWQQLDACYQIFLDQSWQTAGEEILLKWALQSYPEDFKLRQQVAVAPTVDCSRHRQLVIEVLQNRSREIHRYWRIWFTTSSSPCVEVALKLMSGLSSAELDALAEWLQANPSFLTETLWAAIKHCFADLPTAEETINRLKTFIPPKIPQTPDTSWATEAWLGWVSDEYMPYLAWVLRHNQARDTQIALANRFADWLVSAYPALMFDKNAPFITNQLSHLQNILDNEQADVVFWLIVDGLTWWQGKALANNLVARGLTIARLEPTLSALPSLTFISKRALAQGYLDQSTEKQPIKKLLKNRLQRDIPSAQIFTQDRQFEAAVSSNLQPGVYVLLYNTLDTHNHEAQKFTDDESVEGHLRLLARLTSAGFKQCQRQGLRARALVSSDHGSTLLPADAKTLRVPTFAEAVDDEDALDTGKNMYQRTRACAVKTLPVGDTLTKIKQDWYLLNRDSFNLPHHFLIPKGYAAVKRRPTGWTHGGTTPEEAVTPFIEVQPEPIDIIPPVVKIEGFLLPAHNSTLQITIANPNPTPLRAIRFTFAEMEQILNISNIPPESQTTAAISVTKASSREETQTIEWQLVYEAGGQNQQFNEQHEIPIRRFQHSEVDDLFEDML